MKRIIVLLIAFLTFSLVQSHAQSQENQKFERLQKLIKEGKVQFIGQKPTFTLKPNPILKYPVRMVTGDFIPKNIELIAREQRKISKAILSVEKEYINAAILQGLYKEPILPKCINRTQFDWRSYGKVTPVKNQGACGSCTTFATNGAFEGSNAVRNNLMWDSSEQHLLSCSPGVDCNGGSRATLAQHMVDTGTSTEASYPYTAVASACDNGISTPHNAIAWDFVSDATPTVAELKDALCTHGPIAIGILATPTFQAYGGGIFNEAVANTSSNHAMTLVGWDNREGGYWIVKNSWGTTWGENGYVRIAWGSNNVGRWANWIKAPLNILNMHPEKWHQILIDRKIPTRNKYLR